MATQKVVGQNPFARFDELTMAPAFVNSAFAATGDNVYWAGRYWNPAGTSKSISRVCFRFGTTTITTSGLTVSLQDVDTANGPPIRPDGTQDQTVAVASGAIAANTWIRTGTLSATRTVTPGDLLACVVEFDGSGRQGSDSIGISNLGLISASNRRLGSICGTKTTGTYAAATAIPNIVFEHDDGTFGTLLGGLPASAVNTHAITGTAEHALAFSLPFPVTLDSMEPFVSTVSGISFNTIFYSGTTALISYSQNPKTLELAPGPRCFPLPFSSHQDIAANTTCYVAVGGASGSSTSVYSIDVADANHLSLWPGGANFNYATRASTGVGWTTTATRRFMAMISGIGFDDGAGSGSGINRAALASGLSALG